MTRYRGVAVRKISFRSVAVLLGGLSSTIAAQTADPTAPPHGPFSYHSLANVFIRVRDGVQLATDLYIPNGGSRDRYPVVLIRTPYGNFPGHSHNETAVEFFASHGYVVAVQDTRGKFRSEGIYTVSGGDADDGYDTVDWLSKQPWSNGRVGTYGCSYLGDVQIFLAQTKHPALKAMIPQASGSAVGSAGHLYRYFGARLGGASAWAAGIGWFADNGQKISPKLPAALASADYAADYRPWNQGPKPAVLDYQRAWYHLPMKDALHDQGLPPSDFEDTITKAPGDPYWSKFPYMTDAYTSDVPALFVNSWYDFGADVTLFEYNWYRTHSVSAQARANQYAIVSPGVHCSSEREARAEAFVGSRPMGDTRFDYWHAYLTWFDYWLKGSSEARKEIDAWPRLRYYLMGANTWKSSIEWPVQGTRFVNYYLSSQGHANSLFGDGALSTSSPATETGETDSYVYDPASPVPSRGGAMCCTGTVDATPGALDQRPVEARHDVLVYTSDPLTVGVEVTGPVEAVLYVSSSAVDTDFTAKLVDVYPDGRAFNVLETILRARYREGQEREVWMQPNHVYQIRLPVGATSNYFGARHRIRVEVSSSNFPEFDRNLNMAGNNAEGTSWVTATNVVHHSTRYPSRIVLATVPQ
jgi:putative CocE/NonD family hydrolase